MWRRTRRGLVDQACCRNTFGTFGKEQGKAPQKHAVHLAEIHYSALYRVVVQTFIRPDRAVRVYLAKAKERPAVLEPV